MRPIAKLALTVTVRTGLLWLLRRIADELGVPRSTVLDEARTVLANDEDLAVDLAGDESCSVDLR
jgi:hypothetical protein